MSKIQQRSYGPLDSIIDSCPDIHAYVNSEAATLWDSYLDEPNYYAAALTCMIAFRDGYSARTSAENHQVMSAVDDLFVQYEGQTETGVGYALDMTFGESLGLDIHDGKAPLTFDDLTPYPHFKNRAEYMSDFHVKAVARTSQHLQDIEDRNKAS